MIYDIKASLNGQTVRRVAYGFASVADRKSIIARRLQRYLHE